MSNDILKVSSAETQVALPEGPLLLPVYDEYTGTTRFLSLEAVEIRGRRYLDEASLVAQLQGQGQDAERTVEHLDELSFNCGLVLKPLLRVVLIGDKEIPDPLTVLEFSILHAIMRAADRISTREEIIHRVWGGRPQNQPKSLHAIDAHLSEVKRKLDAQDQFIQNGEVLIPEGANRGIVGTVRGVGFRVGARAYDTTPLVYPAA